MWIFLLDQYLIITNVSFPTCPYYRLAFQLCCLLIRFSLTINKRSQLSQGIHIKSLLNFSRVMSYCVRNAAATHFIDFLSIFLKYCRLAFQLCCLLIRFSLTIKKRSQLSQEIHIKCLLNFSRAISYCVSITDATHLFDFLSIIIEMFSKVYFR